MEYKLLPVRLYSLCLTILAATTGVEPLRGIHYALFTSGPEGGFDSSGAIPAMELAEEEIFRDPSVLEGFSLTHMPVKDTLCNRTRSLDLFFASVAQATPPVLGLLGCGCSVASEPVAEIIHHWNISQIAYGSSAISLSDRQRFVNFFRTYPSDENLAPSLLSFLQFYGWNRIMFITQEQNLFTDAFQSLSPLLDGSNITTRNRMVPNSIPILQTALEKQEFFFPDDDIRVIFINTYSNIARIVLCEALRSHGIVGYPRYVWITYAWYQEEWWTSAVNDDPVRCSEDELVQLLKLSIAIQIVPIPDDPNAQTNVGQTTNEFNEQYIKRLNETATQGNNYTFSFIAAIAYDTVWSFALALNNTITMLGWPKDEITNKTGCQDDGTDINGFELDNFTYNHTFVGCIIRWSLAQTNFTGVSGQITFDRNGSRELDQIMILQYRDDHRTIILETFGYIDSLNNFTFTYVNNEGNKTVFPDGIPLDGTPIDVISSFHLALVIVYDILAFLGLIYTTVCLIFNFVFRKRKIVRLTSPNLNYFIIAGSYIMYASIFIRIMRSTDFTVNYVRCNVLLNTTAYCLAFGTVLVKMGRIYHIFNNPTEKRKARVMGINFIKALKDWHMAVIVAVITGAGVLIPLLGWSIPLLQAIPTLWPDEENMFGENDRGVRLVFMVWQCTVNNNANRVNTVIFLYLVLLQVIAIVLAIQTRRVKIKVLNDSKYIIALIYISSITVLVLAVVAFVLGATININETLTSGALLFATTSFLSLTFIPKMVSLYRDPFGERILSTSNDVSTINVSRGGALVLRSKDERIMALESRIKELEDERRDRENTSRTNQRREVNCAVSDDIEGIERHQSMEEVTIIHQNATVMQETEKNDEITNSSQSAAANVVTL